MKGRLGDLTKRRQALETSIAEIAISIASIERDRVDEAVIRKALAALAEIFDDLPPYQKKEMIRLVLHSARATDTEMQLAFTERRWPWPHKKNRPEMVCQSRATAVSGSSNVTLFITFAPLVFMRLKSGSKNTRSIACIRDFPGDFSKSPPTPIIV